MYGLIDVNNMYVSCERAFNPALKGVPVVAMGNNDHCVIARSQEAKDLGIKMGQPRFLIKELLEEHNVRICSSNYELYGDMSARLMSILSNFAASVEVYSIDEAFIQIEDTFDQYSHYPSYEGLGKDIREKVAKWLRLPICVGFAHTKTLAKVANKRAKSNPDLEGVCVLNSSESVEEALREFPIKDLWGIGGRYASLLKKNGITNAWELRTFDNLDWIQSHMTVNGLRMVYELRGYPCKLMEVNMPPKKNICTAVSFGKLIPDLKNIQDALTTYLARCCEKLRRQDSMARHMTVFLHTNPNRITPGNGQPAKQYSASRHVQLPHHSNNLSDFLQYALPTVESIFKFGYNYQKVGVILNDIVPDTHRQGGVLTGWPDEKRLRLGKTVDKINRRFGQDKVHVASAMTKPDWPMIQDSLSKRYTTRWGELPVAS